MFRRQLGEIKHSIHNLSRLFACACMFGVLVISYVGTTL